MALKKRKAVPAKEPKPKKVLVSFSPPKPAPQEAAPAAPVASAAAKPSKGMAVAALLINVFLIPGLGTVLAGKQPQGGYQIGFLLAGVVVMVLGAALATLAVGLAVILILLGILGIVVAWIWSIVSGFQLIATADP
jgi:hypothetical protein